MLLLPETFADELRRALLEAIHPKRSAAEVIDLCRALKALPVAGQVTTELREVAEEEPPSERVD